ncbi:MAG: hypothetical protein EPO28_15405 [Saprospiraceae bacterium]|nr:MAG: hypothetical protein EPO28_15405 [Saprospiraceae bacterium]
MTAEFTIHFDSAEEFLRLLQVLKESGIKHFTFNPAIRPKKRPKQEKTQWAFGIGNLAGKLDHVNIRDYAYED